MTRPGPGLQAHGGPVPVGGVGDRHGGARRRDGPPLRHVRQAAGQHHLHRPAVHGVHGPVGPAVVCVEGGGAQYSRGRVGAWGVQLATEVRCVA